METNFEREQKTGFDLEKLKALPNETAKQALLFS